MAFSPDPAPLRQRLQAALPAAMRARDAAAVSALRTALAAIDNAEAVPTPAAPAGAVECSPAGAGAAEAARRELTAGEVAALVREQVRERTAAADDYDRAGRPQRADRLRAEAATLARHLDDA